MISLNCTSCKKVLEIDDAFAGGVCRCRHCGTIQTVPSSLKRSNRAGAPASTTGAKTLYQKTSTVSPGNRAGTGLENLAETVGTSSGLARGDLRTRAAAPQAPPTRSLPLHWLYAGGAALTIVLILILWLVFR